MPASTALTSPSATASGPWTTKGIAPATTYEVILAANLVVVAAYDGVDPEGDLLVPADLAFFLEDTSTEGSFKFAKDKMDATGRTPTT